jgi:hypothetical protein
VTIFGSAKYPSNLELPLANEPVLP